MQIAEINMKIMDSKRISRSEAEFLYQEASLDQLSEMATTCRDRIHTPSEATYLIMAIINYTNICVAKCDYCSFYRLPHQTGTYLLNKEQIFEKIDALRELGGTMVGFNGGFHPKLRIDDYADIFESVRARYGNEIEFYGMTVAEFMFASKVSRMSYDDAAKTLRDRGSKWITGGGAEISRRQLSYAAQPREIQS